MLSSPLSRFRCSDSQVAGHQCTAVLPERRLWHDLRAAEHRGSCEQPVILITWPVENEGFKTNGANVSWWFKGKRSVIARIYGTKGQSLPVFQRWSSLAKKCSCPTSELLNAISRRSTFYRGTGQTVHSIITVDNKSVKSFSLKKTHFDKARWMAAVYSPTLWLAKPVLKRGTTHSTLAFA